MWLVQTCQLSRFSRESPSLIKSPSLPVRASNLRPLWNTYRGLFQNSFINFVILEMSETKIKQELDLVLLFELISMGKRKTEQSDWYIFNEYRNWSEINQSNCTMHGRKLARFSHAVIDVRKNSEGLWVIFGEYSDIAQTDILTIQRFLDISRFLYSGS